MAVTFAENTVLEECLSPDVEAVLGSNLKGSEYKIALEKSTYYSGKHILGYILAEDIHSMSDLPPVKTSIMDGYAIKCGLYPVFSTFNSFYR